MKAITVRLVTTGFLLLAFLAVFFGCGGQAPAPAAPTTAATQAPAQKVFKLVFQSGMVQGDAHAIAEVQQFLEPLEKKSNGRLQFEKHFGGELVPQAEIFPSMGKGVVDIGTGGSVWHAGMVPEFSLTWMPMIYASHAECESAWWEVQRPLLDKYLQEKFNTKIFAMVNPSGMRLTTIKSRPVQKIEDLKGLKIRGQGGAVSIFLQKLGAATVSMPYAEAVAALPTGALEGVYWGEVAVRDYKLWDVVSNIIDNPMGFSHSEIYWNLDSWKKLPPDLQQLVEEQARLASYYEGVVHGPKADAEIRAQNLAKGVKFYTLPPAELERWVKVGQETWDWFASQTPLSKQLMDATRAYLGK